MSQAAVDIPRKRQRVTQACHRCRSKKYKCNSVRPACSTCIASNSECSYGTTVKRRGLQSGYVRAIEILWGLVFKRIAESQDGVNKLLVELSVVINQTPADSNGNDNADDLLKYWRSSCVPSAIESLLDGEVINSPRLQAYTYQDHCDTRKSLDDRRRGEFSSLWAALALGEVHSYGISSSRVVQFRSISQYFLSKDPMHEDYLDYAQALLLESTLHLGRNNLVLAKSALAQAFVLSSGVEGQELSAKVAFQKQLHLTLSGCFVVDTLLSFTMGTRPQMTSDDLPSGSPCDESGSDEWEPFVNKFGKLPSSGSSSVSTLAAPSRVSSTFNYLVKLLCIPNAAMREQTPKVALTASIEACRVVKQLQEVQDLIADTTAMLSTPDSAEKSCKIVHIHDVGQARSLASPYYIVGTVPDSAPVTEAEKMAVKILDHYLASAEDRGIFLDMCFQPRATRNIKLARKHGWQTVEGTEIIGHQIQEQYRVWISPESDAGVFGPQLAQDAWSTLRAAAESSTAIIYDVDGLRIGKL
ncbi:hypothetical protein D6C92_01974 [Aureobasidium pullulans]|nr:hypothetical protein D6C92_01974 [Aureobasidium pullulans]